MTLGDELAARARRVASRLGAGLTAWSGGREGDGEGEQTHAARSGHLDSEDPSLFAPRVYGDPAKLHVASTAVVNDALFNLSSGEITVGEWAFFGHGVSVLTGTHDWRIFGEARQTAVPKSGRDVVIEEGVWVSSGATVVGPCRIGANAVVAVGAVVLGDVEPYTIVGGVPAKVIRTIPHGGVEPDADQEPAAAGTPDGTGPRFAAVYGQFADRFRGSRAEVTAKLRPYLDDVRRVLRPTEPGPRVVDVGCGRAEWLTLLRDEGVVARGVDQNADFVATGLAGGLDVVRADAVAYLAGLDEGSLDLVTAFHLVEHLDTETLLALFEAARHALRPGGRLLLETPDPTNLTMGACNFYLDPTHRSPLPPALTAFLVGASGFSDVEIRPLHPDDSPLDPAAGPPSPVEALVVRALRGPRDYAVLALRP
ncbi:MAG: methyltransferase domain-containing protein [Janthinobacterium lividum]